MIKQGFVINIAFFKYIQITFREDILYFGGMLIFIVNCWLRYSIARGASSGFRIRGALALKPTTIARQKQSSSKAQA